MKQAGVYAIKNTINGKTYIGSAKNLSLRWTNHKRDLALGRGSPHLQRAWNKHGAASFQFVVLLYCADPYLIAWEQIAIDGHKAALGWENMYNICPKAGSRAGSKSTPETRERISKGLARSSSLS